MDACDGASEELSGRERGDKRRSLLLGQAHRVREDHLFEFGGAQTLNGRSGEHAMHCAGVDIMSSLLFHQADGLEKGARGIYLVIHNDGDAASDLANEAQGLHAPVVAQTALLDNSQWGVEAFGEVAGLLGEPCVSGDNGKVAKLLRCDVTGEYVLSSELVYRDAKEALYLASMQVHRQHTVGAGDGDAVGEEAGRDGHAWLVLLVGAAIGIVRDDRSDAPG